jgi:hypothetical protein
MPSLNLNDGYGIKGIQNVRRIGQIGRGNSPKLAFAFLASLAPEGQNAMETL